MVKIWNISVKILNISIKVLNISIQNLKYFGSAWKSLTFRSKYQAFKLKFETTIPQNLDF